MEINKQTKIYYMHNLTDDAFLKNGCSIHISTLTSLKEYYFRRKKDINNLPPPGGQIVNSDIAHQLEEKYDRIDSNSLELVFGKVVVVEGYSKDPYYKTVLPLITWSSVADAKTKIFPESSIKTLKIFKWLKKKNISDSEKLNTINCGIGFCLIANKNNIKKIEKIFTKKYKPYQIGYISKNKLQFKKYGKLQW